MKTPHQIAFESYQQFLDGSLSEAARAELKGHLETCAECRARLTVHGRLLEGLNSRWPASVRYRDESPISLSNVQTRYRRQKMFRQIFRPVRAAAWVMVLVMVLFGAGWLAEKFFSQPTEPSIQEIPSTDELITVPTPSLDEVKDQLAQQQHWVLFKEIQAHEYMSLGATDVAFSPDGTKIVTSGSWDKQLKLWDAQTGQLLLTLSGHTGQIFSVAYSPDGQHLASTSEDGTVRVWAVDSGALLHTLSGPEGVLRDVTFSPEGNWVAVAAREAVWIWDVKDGTLLRKDENLNGQVMKVQFSPDGQYIASVDKILWIRDRQTGQIIFQSNPYNDWVKSIAFSSDMAWLAVTQGKDIEIWNILERSGGSFRMKLTQTVSTYSEVVDLYFLPDHQTLAIGNRASILFDNIQTGETIGYTGISFDTGTYDNLRNMAVTPNGDFVAAVYGDGFLRLWQYFASQVDYIATRPSPNFFSRSESEWLEIKNAVQLQPEDGFDIFSLSKPQVEEVAGFPVALPETWMTEESPDNYTLYGAAYNPELHAVIFRYSNIISQIYITQKRLDNPEGTLGLVSPDIPDLGAWTFVESVDIGEFPGEYVYGGWWVYADKTNYDPINLYTLYLTSQPLPINAGTFPTGQWVTAFQLSTEKQDNSLMWLDDPTQRILRWRTENYLFEIRQNIVSNDLFQFLLEKQALIQLATEISNAASSLDAQTNSSSNSEYETFSETDLNCDGTLERLSGIRAPEIEYFEVSPQLQTLRLETDNGSGYQSVWEVTAEAEGVAYLYYELFSQECSGLLTQVGHKGTESVQVFAWDGETIKRVLHITGRFLVGAVPDLESYPLEEPVPQNTLFITELQSLDTDNVWILRGYQWDGEKLIETLQTQFRFPKGG